MVNRKLIEETYEKHAEMIMRICYLHLKNSEDAKDVFQEVFVALFMREGVFENDEHEKSWLIRVAINKCSNVSKNFWRRKTQGLDDVEIVFNQKVESEVMDAVFELPQKYKVPIYLFYYEGYAAQEIAAILEQKENTVYSNLHRGRKKLKEKLGGDSFEE